MANSSLSACLAEIKANSGKYYVYVLSSPDGVPFYVGCGKKWRIAGHERESRRPGDDPSPKIQTIRDITSAGRDVIYAIRCWADSWLEIAEKEIEAIAAIGRRDLQRGPLTNLTDGGEGASNLSAESQAKHAAAVAQSWNAARKVSVSAKTKEMWSKNREAIREAMTKAQRAPSLTEKHKRNGKIVSAAHIQKMKNDPDYAREVAERRRRLSLEPEARQAASAHLKRVRNDPALAHKYKDAAIRRAPEHSARFRRLNASDDGFIARRNARIAAVNADPEMKARSIAAVQAANARPEIVARLLSRNKKLAADPEFCTARDERLRAHNENRRLLKQRCRYLLAAH